MAEIHYNGYTITHSIPTTEEHIRLRTLSGLTPPPPAAVPSALAHSVHGIVARTATGEAVGMVRCIGDGALFLQLVDMAVHPDHQGKGLGKCVLDTMLEWIDQYAPDAYLSLIGDSPGQKLYKSRGFVETIGRGMTRARW